MITRPRSAEHGVSRPVALLAALLGLRLLVNWALSSAMSSGAPLASVELYGRIGTAVALLFSLLLLVVVGWLAWSSAPRRRELGVAFALLASGFLAQAVFFVLLSIAPRGGTTLDIADALRMGFWTAETLAVVIIVISRAPRRATRFASLVPVACLSLMGLGIGWQIVARLVGPTGAIAPEAGWLWKMRGLAELVLVLWAVRTTPPTSHEAAPHALIAGWVACAALFFVADALAPGPALVLVPALAVLGWGATLAGARAEPRLVASSVLPVAAVLGVRVWARMRDPAIDWLFTPEQLDLAWGATSLARVASDIAVTLWQATVVAWLAWDRAPTKVSRAWRASLSIASAIWLLSLVAAHRGSVGAATILVLAWLAPLVLVRYMTQASLRSDRGEPRAATELE